MLKRALLEDGSGTDAVDKAHTVERNTTKMETGDVRTAADAKWNAIPQHTVAVKESKLGCKSEPGRVVRLFRVPNEKL